jgi:hypothetical protein
MGELVAAQPFSSVEIEEFYLDKVPRQFVVQIRE